jgi:hypothetical protein
MAVKLLVSHTKEEHRLSAFEKGVLKRIFGPKREEVAGGWRRLHNEELHKLDVSSELVGAIRSGRVR